MKELEKIQLLKEVRKGREAAEKISEENPVLKEMLRRTDNPKDKAGLLDFVINNSYNCTHEYGLQNKDDAYTNLDCMCLDCGKYLESKDLKTLYEVRDNMNLIREEYLELIQDMSICDSFSTLSRKYNFKKH